MKLINSLRSHLVTNIAHFQSNPDRLIISVEKGSLIWSHGSLSHRQQYTAVVEIDEYPEHLDADAMMIPLLQWYSDNQDPFDSKDPPIKFESYVLSNGSTTVVFTVKLAESVVVKVDDSGEILVNHCEIKP